MPPQVLSFLLWKILRSRWRRLHVRAALVAAAATVLVILAGSWLVVRCESGAPRATVTSFPRALWWSAETATTVGYGDMYPVTVGGRIVAVVLMLVGISAFSIITASVATRFVEEATRRLHRLGGDLHRAEERGARQWERELRAVHDRFDRLENLLHPPHGAADGGPDSAGGYPGPPGGAGDRGPRSG